VSKAKRRRGKARGGGQSQSRRFSAQNVSVIAAAGITGFSSLAGAAVGTVGQLLNSKPSAPVVVVEAPGGHRREDVRDVLIMAPRSRYVGRGSVSLEPSTYDAGGAWGGSMWSDPGDIGERLSHRIAGTSEGWGTEFSSVYTVSKSWKALVESVPEPTRREWYRNLDLNPHGKSEQELTATLAVDAYRRANRMTPLSHDEHALVFFGGSDAVVDTGAETGGPAAGASARPFSESVTDWSALLKAGDAVVIGDETAGADSADSPSGPPAS
jgi:hypothetical protein